MPLSSGPFVFMCPHSEPFTGLTQYQSGSKTDMLNRSLGQAGKTGLSQNCPKLTLHCSRRRNTIPPFFSASRLEGNFLAIFEQISENEVSVLYRARKDNDEPFIGTQC